MSRKNRSRKKDEAPAEQPVAVEAEETLDIVEAVDIVETVGGVETIEAVEVIESESTSESSETIQSTVEPEPTSDVEPPLDADAHVESSSASELEAEPELAQESASEVQAETGVQAESEVEADAEAGADAEPVARDTSSYDRLKPIIEALIFASPEPLTPKTLFKLLESEPKEDVETALALLKQDYDRPSGLQLVEVAGGYQIVTRPELHEYVRRLFHERTSQKLSVQALETLAVIAYRQPVTAPEITEIRGVNTSGVLNTLVDRKLVKIVGRKDVVGRPFMYATTRDFLDKFGLNDISDLPKVEDLADVLGFEPPSLDGSGTDATALAFDFGEPVEAVEAVEAVEVVDASASAPESAAADASAPVDEDAPVEADEAATIQEASPIADSAPIDEVTSIEEVAIIEEVAPVDEASSESSREDE